MAESIKIEIPSDPAHVHRFRNFGEALYRSLRGVGSVSMAEIDASTSNLIIRDIKRSELGNVMQIIEREIKRSNFDASASVSRE